MCDGSAPFHTREPYLHAKNLDTPGEAVTLSGLSASAGKGSAHKRIAFSRNRDRAFRAWRLVLELINTAPLLHLNSSGTILRVYRGGGSDLFSLGINNRTVFNRLNANNTGKVLSRIISALDNVPTGDGPVQTFRVSRRDDSFTTAVRCASPASAIAFHHAIIQQMEGPLDGAGFREYAKSITLSLSGENVDTPGWLSP